MELKLQNWPLAFPLFGLLIVPYGIETRVFHSPFLCHPKLLIVPYGIETDEPFIQDSGPGNF